MTSLLTTNPATIEQASTEILPRGCDVTALLAVGETPSAPVVTLTDLGTNLPYAPGLVGSAAFVGNVLVQTIGGLVAGHSYELVFGFTAAAGKVWAPGLRIECPR